ncbi:hypothetical protein TRICI_001491 [Trichomonascus ciferrii]|uniref:Major facilitator superfamily (MFS) profile domain-containing protein n=1 Tax=Trichomonascus ciferrii TaxID=44093 RepID=A0A642V944_9ASCO|nr:hypothetical protein TRICI_001491 [Trichomonascus ciferrii]
MMNAPNAATRELTVRLLITVAAIGLGPLQFGYHLAELNAPQSIISCETLDPTVADCIPMNSRDIGLVNSINAIGGCFGAAFSGSIADKIGRRRCSFINCLFFILGPLLMATATSVPQMCLGRFIAGVGAGSSIVVTPVYVNEISPPELRGALGSMIQLFVNFGIMGTQFLGIFWSTEEKWRSILYGGSVVGIVNAILLPICVESPKWLALNGMVPESKKALAVIRKSPSSFDDELLQWRIDAGFEPNSPQNSAQDTSSESAGLLEEDASKESNTVIGVWEFFTNPQYRRVLSAVIGIMVIQQVCGVNSIVFYGVSILSTSLPQYSRVINCFISLMNCIVTAFVAPAVDRFGRKPLLLLSTTGMGFFAGLLTLGLVIDSSLIASLSACLFVISFASGLGPIPFLIISELSPGPAVGVAQSVATTANWFSTFLVGFLFPILKASLDTKVFLVFTFTATCSIVFFLKFVPETKGKPNADRVWEDF